MKSTFPLLTILLIASASLCANAATITVHADKPVHKIAPTLWGISLELVDGGQLERVAIANDLSGVAKPSEAANDVVVIK
jgi:hypothetical protein